MSSGFVSGGTVDAPIERSDEWLAAQTELEANRAKKAAEARAVDGRSLFETLEANKAAKQEAFEEANRLKNQFRSLDEDEVEFLDSVLESTRAEEERVKRETREGLEIFRRQQEEADKKAREGDDGIQDGQEGSPVAEQQWVAGTRKRRRKPEKEVLKGVKIRRTSSAVEDAKAVKESSASPARKEPEPESTKSAKPAQEKKIDEKPKPASTPSKPSVAPAKSGLVDYGSDEDDDW